MLECAGGILSFDVCGVSFGYLGLCTVAGAASGVYLLAHMGPAIAVASGLGGAILGFLLGLVTLPILALFVVLAIFALGFGAFAALCYLVFVASQQIA